MRVGIKRIGYKLQEQENDVWVEEQQQSVRGANDPVAVDVTWFDSIDQANASLSEEFVDEANGSCMEATLQFIVRKDRDIQRIMRLGKQPTILYVEAVDGNKYNIGSKKYPVRLKTTNSYQGTSTREVSVTVTYRSIQGVMTL